MSEEMEIDPPEEVDTPMEVDEEEEMTRMETEVARSVLQINHAAIKTNYTYRETFCGQGITNISHEYRPIQTIVYKGKLFATIVKCFEIFSLVFFSSSNRTTRVNYSSFRNLPISLGSFTLTQSISVPSSTTCFPPVPYSLWFLSQTSVHNAMS